MNTTLWGRADWQDRPVTDVEFPVLQARTARFTLGRPRGFTVAPDGSRIAFVRSRGGTDRGSWKPDRRPMAASISLEVGDRVSHDKYGLGTVVACEGAGARANATIDFGSSGTVRLMLIGGVPLTKL